MLQLLRLFTYIRGYIGCCAICVRDPRLVKVVAIDAVIFLHAVTLDSLLLHRTSRQAYLWPSRYLIGSLLAIT